MSDTSAYGFGFDNGTAIALGTFDGVHLGHISVLKTTVENAENLNTIALTFYTPPKKAKMLCTAAKKEQLILNSGINQVFTLDFDFIKDLSPTEFFEKILIESFNAKLLVCGFNYRFGKNASGDAAFLKKLCDENGISLIICDEFQKNGQSVSSTVIRELITNGDCEKVSDILGRFFEIGEIVSSGKHLGSKFGFATANITVSDDLIVPQKGVYATYTKIADKIYPSVTNFGNQPTFDGKNNICETHIIGFDQDIYGNFIEIGFIKKIRNIEKFDCIELLSKQIDNDKLLSTGIFKQNYEKILKTTLQI